MRASSKVKATKKSSKRSHSRKDPFGDGSKLFRAEQVRSNLAVGKFVPLKIAGRWPEFMMLDKEKLSIDLSYQREHVFQLVKDIASKFNREWFQACIVSDRGNGVFAVMEGGQRWAASLLRDNSEIQSIPCLVYRFDNIKQEAAVFEVINKKRKGVSAIEKFLALVAQDIEGAVALKGLIYDSGFSLFPTSSPDSFACIGVLRTIYAKHLKSRPNHFGDLLILLRCLEDNGAGVFRTIGFVVHAISDLMDLSYDGTVPELNVLQRIFSGINFNELINSVNSEFNSRKVGTNPSRREILKDALVIRCKQAKP